VQWEGARRCHHELKRSSTFHSEKSSKEKNNEKRKSIKHTRANFKPQLVQEKTAATIGKCHAEALSCKIGDKRDWKSGVECEKGNSPEDGPGTNRPLSKFHKQKETEGGKHLKKKNRGKERTGIFKRSKRTSVEALELISFILDAHTWV